MTAARPEFAADLYADAAILDPHPLYRAVRELLINVGKHARASRADVHLQSRDGFLVVRVEDETQATRPEASHAAASSARVCTVCWPLPS